VTFPVPIDDGAADHLRRGVVLPHVSLVATDLTEIDLATLPGRSLVIVYPWTGRPGLSNPPGWDDIPGAHGSTPELEGSRDRAEDFARAGIRLWGLSRQASGYQRELAVRLRLPFPLLSDAGGGFAGALGLPTFATGGEIYLKRLTLVVDRGCIAACFYPVPDPAGHAGLVLRWLRGGGSPGR
jgi:peroxiredoxin